MARKTYRTYSFKSFITSYKDEKGRRHEIVFRGGIQIDSTAIFVTEDKRIQDALESGSSFNKHYYLESTEKTEEEKVEKPAPKAEKKVEVEKPVITDVKDVKRFRNLVEMRNAMKELGLPVKDDSNYVECKSIAAKEGYDFQIQKAK